MSRGVSHSMTHTIVLRMQPSAFAAFSYVATSKLPSTLACPAPFAVLENYSLLLNASPWPQDQFFSFISTTSLQREVSSVVTGVYLHVYLLTGATIDLISIVPMQKVTCKGITVSLIGISSIQAQFIRRLPRPVQSAASASAELPLQPGCAVESSAPPRGRSTITKVQVHPRLPVPSPLLLSLHPKNLHCKNQTVSQDQNCLSNPPPPNLYHSDRTLSVITPSSRRFPISSTRKPPLSEPTFQK